MKIQAVLVLAAAMTLVHGQTKPLPALAEPSLAPDRPEVAFVSGGDIWTVPLNGGEARLLVSHPATESRPVYSPDGSSVAFSSTRTGNGDVYVLNLGGGQLKRLTFSDSPERVEGWSHDGQWIYFSSTRTDIAGMNDIHRVRVTGGTPMPVSDDRYASEYFAAPSPVGEDLAFTAKGVVSAQWWRHGHSHIDESEIWVRREGSPARYERITTGKAKDAWPMWSAEGKRLYFVSDRSGAENIWTQPFGGAAKQLTHFTNGRVLWPGISYDGKTIVFERDFGIWQLNTQNGNAARIPVTLRGAVASPAIAHQQLTQGFRALALSHDGKKIAFTAHGEIFAAASKEGGVAARVTTTPANEFEMRWSPDNRRLVYVSDRDGAYGLYLYDFATGTETRITNDAQGDSAPGWSPDGKLIAFMRGGKELRVYDMEKKSDRLVASGYFSRPPSESGASAFAWSPDNRWIAYLSAGNQHFTNVSIVDLEGGQPKLVSFLPNSYGTSLAWSPDGTYLLFQTGQRTENGTVARIDLIPRVPKFREDTFRDLFREENPRSPVVPTPAPTQTTPPATSTPVPPSASSTEPAATPTDPKTLAPAAPAKDKTKPVRIVFEEIRRRISFLPTGLDVGFVTISPDGKLAVLIAEAAGQENLYTYSLDELAKEPAVAKQLTSTPGAKRDPQFSPDGKEIYFLESGRVQVINVDTRVVRPVAVTAEMDVDFAQDKEEVFAQAWTYLRDNFHDPEFHGLDWKAIRLQFEPYIQGAQTPDEVRRIISLMIGELNASHLGIGTAPTAQASTTGTLGLRFDRREYETSGKLKITNVLSLSPAALSGDIKPGDYLIAVGGKAISGTVNLDELLENNIDKRVVLTVAPNPDGTGKKEIPVRPVSIATEKKLLYRDWVESQRAYVHKISNGRLGYVHMPDMGSSSLEQLALDLDVENQARDGVIIDVRNNNGGFVNAYALDILARRGYMTMTVRGGPPAPARSLLGQRALEKPTILVTNQESLSDAEDFAEGYRALKVGKIVGEPTAGWIIYTGNVPLIDGSLFRIPAVRITTAEGADMEMHPRPVDILVERPIGESFTEKDSQLDRAAAELLKQIGPAKSAR
jgi:tricorn protease